MEKINNKDRRKVFLVCLSFLNKNYILTRIVAQNNVNIQHLLSLHEPLGHLYRPSGQDPPSLEPTNAKKKIKISDILM